MKQRLPLFLMALSLLTFLLSTPLSQAFATKKAATAAKQRGITLSSPRALEHLPRGGGKLSERLAASPHRSDMLQLSRTARESVGKGQALDPLFEQVHRQQQKFANTYAAPLMTADYKALATQIDSRLSHQFFTQQIEKLPELRRLRQQIDTQMSGILSQNKLTTPALQAQFKELEAMQRFYHFAMLRLEFEALDAAQTQFIQAHRIAIKSGESPAKTAAIAKLGKARASQKSANKHIKELQIEGWLDDVTKAEAQAVITRYQQHRTVYKEFVASDKKTLRTLEPTQSGAGEAAGDALSGRRGSVPNAARMSVRKGSSAGSASPYAAVRRPGESVSTGSAFTAADDQFLEELGRYLSQ